MTILGAFMFASVLLTSCGGPEADGKKMADCACEGMQLMKEAQENPEKEDDLKAEFEKLEEKCDKLGDEMEKKYKDEESEDFKAFEKAFEKALKDCE